MSIYGTVTQEQILVSEWYSLEPHVTYKRLSLVITLINYTAQGRPRCCQRLAHLYSAGFFSWWNRAKQKQGREMDNERPSNLSKSSLPGAFTFSLWNYAINSCHCCTHELPLTLVKPNREWKYCIVVSVMVLLLLLFWQWRMRLYFLSSI